MAQISSLPGALAPNQNAEQIKKAIIERRRFKAATGLSSFKRKFRTGIAKTGQLHNYFANKPKTEEDIEAFMRSQQYNMRVRGGISYTAKNAEAVKIHSDIAKSKPTDKELRKIENAVHVPELRHKFSALNKIITSREVTHEELHKLDELLKEEHLDDKQRKAATEKWKEARKHAAQAGEHWSNTAREHVLKFLGGYSKQSLAAAQRKLKLAEKTAAKSESKTPHRRFAVSYRDRGPVQNRPGVMNSATEFNTTATVSQIGNTAIVAQQTGDAVNLSEEGQERSHVLGSISEVSGGFGSVRKGTSKPTSRTGNGNPNLRPVVK